MRQLAQRMTQRFALNLPRSLRTSVALKAMVFLAFPIGGLSIVLGSMGYQNTVNSLETQTNDRLREYLTERSKQESQIFELAQRNHVHLKSIFTDRLTQARATEPDPEFDAIMKPWSDGTVRNFPQDRPITSFDTKKNATIFVGRGVKLTQTLKQDILTFKSLTETYGPAWSSSFIDTWINSSANVSVNYWKGSPWALSAPAKTDINQEEYGYIAHKNKNPDRSPRWTGVYYDDAPKKWMVSLVTPVDDAQGNHVASIGNDIILDDLLSRTAKEYLPGTRNIILSKEGRLIVDSEHQGQHSDALQNTRSIDQHHDLILEDLLETAQGMTTSIALTQTIDRQSIVGIAPLSGTDWYFITIYPKHLIAQQAVVYTLPIVLLTAFALILEILYIYFVLRNQIIHPLQKIVFATRKVSGNIFKLNLNITRSDEIGELSRAVTQMADSLEQSFAKLEYQNEALESQVNDRTEALRELQQTQAQLIQSEKMSGLGQMVAGIAHEINNPVSFIHGNLYPAKTYITGLLQHLHLYQNGAAIDRLQTHAKAIDLEFLVEDLPKILSSMQIGTDRICEIVLSLRNFSRLDESDRKTVDIHEGIESTLLILNHRLRLDIGTVAIHRNYGTFSSIACFPSQLNQVIMNLLSNSIDAFDTPTPLQTPPTITITTEAMLDQNQIQIRIQDNGSGIPKDVQSRMFDPFFTTKSIGKGTGLGLSISYQIITVKHQGTLICDSSPECGTTFTITLPIDPTAALPLERSLELA